MLTSLNVSRLGSPQSEDALTNQEGPNVSDYLFCFTIIIIMNLILFVFCCKGRGTVCPGLVTLRLVPIVRTTAAAARPDSPVFATAEDTALSSRLRQPRPAVFSLPITYYIVLCYYYIVCYCH